MHQVYWIIISLSMKIFDASSTFLFNLLARLFKIKNKNIKRIFFTKKLKTRLSQHFLRYPYSYYTRISQFRIPETCCNLR